MLKRNEQFFAKRFEQDKNPHWKTVLLLDVYNGESDRRNELKHDGTPYAVKVACTVWSGGKFSDYFKELPITINTD